MIKEKYFLEKGEKIEKTELKNFIGLFPPGIL